MPSRSPMPTAGCCRKPWTGKWKTCAWLARRSGGQRLPPESMTPSQTAIQLAMKQQSPVITEDLAQAEMNLQAAASIVAQGLRAVVVIPLYASARASTDASATDEIGRAHV